MQFKPFFVMILLMRAGACLLHGSIGYVGSGGGVAQSDSFRSVWGDWAIDGAGFCEQ